MYKKTDSALRGPVGAELEGVSRVLPGRRFFVIPAVPEMGKTTRGGRLFERGIPADQTEYGKDPATPVLDNDIRKIILATGQVDFDVVDAESSHDIDRAVGQALAAGQVIFAGSVGLADALARRLEPRPWSEPAGRVHPRTLVVSGSRYPAAREQLELAARASGQEVDERAEGIEGRRTSCRGVGAGMSCSSRSRRKCLKDAVMPDARSLICSKSSGSSSARMRRAPWESSAGKPHLGSCGSSVRRTSWSWGG